MRGNIPQEMNAYCVGCGVPSPLDKVDQIAAYGVHLGHAFLCECCAVAAVRSAVADGDLEIRRRMAEESERRHT